MFLFLFKVMFLFIGYLFSLDVVLDLGDFDLHGVYLLVLDQRDWSRLAVLESLKGEVGQRDVPLTVVLLPFPVKSMRLANQLPS